MNRRLATLGLCLLVTLAGCNLVTSDQPTATSTPAAVPTDQPTPTTEPEVAPGLTASTLSDPVLLVRTNERILNATSYTVFATRTVTHENGSVVVATDERLRVDPRVDRAYLQSVSERAAGTTELAVWSDGDRTAVRADGVSVSESTAGLSARRPAQNQLAAVLIGDGARVTGSVTVGHEFYRTEGIDLFRIVSETPPPSLAMGENFSFVAFVDRSGLVQRYEFRYEQVVDGERLTVVETVRIGRHGLTNTDPPEWATGVLGR